MLIVFADLLLVPFALNFLASRDDYRRYVDALFMSGLLAALWAFTNTISVIWDFPRSKMFHPLVDLIALSIVVTAYMTQRQRWKLLLAFLFLAQLAAHAVFWWGRQFVPPAVGGRDYVGLLNVLWLLQLMCVAYPGGRHVAIRALDRLRGARGVTDMARR